MERYGVMPKRFTKAWWEHFWYYYKWRVLMIAFALFVVIVSCVQCATKIKYDMTISYVGEKYYHEQNLDVFKAAVSKIIDDKNGDGEKNVNVMQMTIATDDSAAAGTEYNSAMMTKEAVEFQAGETYLFFFSRQELDRLLNRDSAEQIFVETTDIFDGDIAEDRIVYKGDKPYAVLVEGSRFLEENKFYNKEVYMAIRCMRESDKDDTEEKIAYNNAVKLANHIIDFENN